jgi:hypothetical protein
MPPLPPNNPEIELLLCCARTNLGPQITERINSLVQQDIDWEYLLKTALRHRVMPLLYKSLKRVCSNGVPDETMGKLRKYYLTNATRNLFFTGRLLEILNLFNNNHILAVPFKGPVLAKCIYGDITLRQFSDLDILIHPNDALKARNVLMANGYQPEIKLDDKQFSSYLKTKDAFTFICHERKMFVDLHWGLKVSNSFSPIHLNLSDNNLKLVKIENHKVITQMVRRAKYERIFSLGLFLAKDLLGAEPPEKIKNYLSKDPKIENLAIAVYRNLFHQNDTSTNTEISDKFSSFHIKVRDSYSEKIRHITRTVMYPTKEDWKRFPLPASISFLLYLLRPIRLFLKLWVVLLKKCFTSIEQKTLK